MNIQSHSFPERPADVPLQATLTEMTDAYHAHLAPLVDERHGLGKPLPAAMLCRHAIAALALQHALAERVLYSRWVGARDALAFGASVDETATAMGLEPDELTAGLTRWADSQRRDRYMTDAEHADVLRLLYGGAR